MTWWHNRNNINGLANWCRGPGIDGSYRFQDGLNEEGHGLQLLSEWELLEIFGVEVLEERIG